MEVVVLQLEEDGCVAPEPPLAAEDQQLLASELDGCAAPERALAAEDQQLQASEVDRSSEVPCSGADPGSSAG